jgi:hypothetical protein
MALPLAPIAGLALRYGAVALTAYAIARMAERGHHRDQRVEDAMDDLPEGVRLRRDSEQVSGAGRFIRTIRVGPAGPGVEIDATAITRIRFRRV